jgi:hypothetical protein
LRPQEAAIVRKFACALKEARELEVEKMRFAVHQFDCQNEVQAQLDAVMGLL